MSDNFLDREAAYIANMMDTGNDAQAADRLRQDLATMDRASFLSVVTKVRQQEQRGVGADLNVYRSYGPGYFENDYISVDKTILQGDSKTPALYQQPIAQYQFAFLDWTRLYLK